MPSYPRYREAQTNLAETDYSRHILAPLPFSPANSAIGLYSDGPETSALQDSRHSGKPALSDNRPVPYPGLPDSPITYPYTNRRSIPGFRINSRIRIPVLRFRIFHRIFAILRCFPGIETTDSFYVSICDHSNSRITDHTTGISI